MFDTICKATDERQSEARLLPHVDQMIVIGDKKSSNAKRLKIRRSLCSDSLIEGAAELTTGPRTSTSGSREHPHRHG
ncbi:MAG: hypothetical protein ACLT4C_06230 [Butyricicoccus sp.]